MKKLFFYIFLFLNFALLQAKAQDKDSANTSPATKGWFGYIDTYYAYDFNKPKNNALPQFVYSHNRHNEFSINNAILGYGFEDVKTRGSFAMHTGTYVESNYAQEPALLRNIYEAYAGFSPIKKLWIDAGVFPSHIGYESAISKDNLTLTRSMMADNSPYYETGVKLTYLANEKWTLRALVLNGWQNIRDRNSNKALGTQIEFKPSKKFKINSSTYYGNEAMDWERRSQRFFHNLYLEATPVSSLKLAFLLDAGVQEFMYSNAQNKTWRAWAATALIGHYKFNSYFGTGARVEYFLDPNNMIVTPPKNSFDRLNFENNFSVGSGSLNLDFYITEKAVFRVEGKMFQARRGGNFKRNNNPTKNESIITTSLAVSF